MGGEQVIRYILQSPNPISHLHRSLLCLPSPDALRPSLLPLWVTPTEFQNCASFAPPVFNTNLQVSGELGFS